MDFLSPVDAVSRSSSGSILDISPYKSPGFSGFCQDILKTNEPFLILSADTYHASAFFTWTLEGGSLLLIYSPTLELGLHFAGAQYKWGDIVRFQPSLALGRDPPILGHGLVSIYLASISGLVGVCLTNHVRLGTYVPCHHSWVRLAVARSYYSPEG